MLNSFGDIRGEVIVRGQISTSSAFHTETTLGNQIDDAHRWAAGYKKWPMTEGRSSTTWSSSTEEWNYPEGWKSDSIRLLQIGGKSFQKLTFADYQKYREDSSSGGDKVYSDFGRIYFVNPNSNVSGTLTVYGQFLPTQIDITDLTATTVFSNFDEDGNEAIVNEALSYIKSREQKSNESTYYHQRAIEQLENLWKKIQDEQFGYQTKNRGIFKRIDVIRGGVQDELLKRDQFF